MANEQTRRRSSHARHVTHLETRHYPGKKKARDKTTQPIWRLNLEMLNLGDGNGADVPSHPLPVPRRADPAREKSTSFLHVIVDWQAIRVEKLSAPTREYQGERVPGKPSGRDGSLITSSPPKWSPYRESSNQIHFGVAIC